MRWPPLARAPKVLRPAPLLRASAIRVRVADARRRAQGVEFESDAAMRATLPFDPVLASQFLQAAGRSPIPVRAGRGLDRAHPLPSMPASSTGCRGIERASTFAQPRLCRACAPAPRAVLPLLGSDGARRRGWRGASQASINPRHWPGDDGAAPSRRSFGFQRRARVRRIGGENRAFAHLRLRRHPVRAQRSIARPLRALRQRCIVRRASSMRAGWLSQQRCARWPWISPAVRHALICAGRRTAIVHARDAVGAQCSPVGNRCPSSAPSRSQWCARGHVEFKTVTQFCALGAVRTRRCRRASQRGN